MSKNKKSLQRQRLRLEIFKELVKVGEFLSLRNIAEAERFIVTGRYQKKRERRKPSLGKVNNL